MRVPGGVGAPVDAPHVGYAQVTGEGDGVKDHADPLLCRRARDAGELVARGAEHACVSAVDLDEAEQGLDGGGLAGAVLADEADDLALADGEVHALERETVVVLGEATGLD